jgi:hypothetical protein
VPAWLAAGVSVVAAVGIALLAMTVVNQRDLDGRQPGEQIPVTAEANASGQFAPSSGLPPVAGPNGPATAGPGPVTARLAPTAGTPVTPTVAATTVVTPTLSGQQPAAVSSLGADDQGFGWPSSAFGTAGG